MSASANKWGRLTDDERRFAAMRDAAPALYEALDQLLVVIEAAAAIKRGDFYHERKAARSALAKARGDQ